MVGNKPPSTRLGRLRRSRAPRSASSSRSHSTSRTGPRATVPTFATPPSRLCMATFARRLTTTPSTVYTLVPLRLCLCVFVLDGILRRLTRPYAVKSENTLSQGPGPVETR
ncbi:hypothetical protein EXIGLDRAFT_263449 [Exidia glandulosa HHB12029]|uniref:Uncharacterized protein n=1 Tax=Exidia glandulosa HHB12029 TaxID=1314781 RepID=A0A165DRA6_EXIGL|nr:hypothetical protein EXIGLDRAFT_263449 [Exidia glandulosa HHB12029]